MSLIVPWGNAFENMSEEAKEIRRQYLEAPEEEKEQLKARLYEAADKRKFCVVINNGSHRCVRHIIRVSDDAEQHLEELKAEYYADYSKLPDDEFVFCTGLHNAEKMYETKIKGAG